MKCYIRNCPSCNTELKYSRKYSRDVAERNGCFCFSCANSGKNNPMFEKDSPKGMLGKKMSNVNRLKAKHRRIGKKHTEKTKTKISASVKKSVWSPETRKRILNSLSKSKWIKVRVDNGQLELLNKWNRLGFNFEPNYQLIKDNFLCYIDGYDKEKNVVLEYDSKYHQKHEQKQKDLLRQQQIISILHPKRFWRYSSETNQFTVIL